MNNYSFFELCPKPILKNPPPDGDENFVKKKTAYTDKKHQTACIIEMPVDTLPHPTTHPTTHTLPHTINNEETDIVSVFKLKKCSATLKLFCYGLY